MRLELQIPLFPEDSTCETCNKVCGISTCRIVDRPKLKRLRFCSLSCVDTYFSLYCTEWIPTSVFSVGPDEQRRKIDSRITIERKDRFNPYRDSVREKRFRQNSQ